MVLESDQLDKPSTASDPCLRGFSFMPETKVVEMNLQFIEGEELERTWRTTKRQRLKEREQKIWDEFVKEQDILNSVCKDDPYQFLEQLPEDCLKELLEMELQKMKRETVEHQHSVEMQQEIHDSRQPAEPNEDPKPDGGGDSPRVTFADDDPGDDSDVIHIFDDERDDDQSGPEDEVLNESMGSPCTVRDKLQDDDPPSLRLSPGKGSSKSSENVTNMIECSIYCAKVRDLRMKINEELAEIVASLERRDIMGIDPSELAAMCRRSAEFCGRFNRIYLYQLHRQIHDVKRNTNSSLPFARHTQFQAQMVRVGSLHQNLLQALQIFHKSFEQTACIRESADMLRCLLQLIREASEVCGAVPHPNNLPAAKDMYTDDVLTSCDKVDEAVKEYTTKMTTYINSTNNTNSSRSKKLSKGNSRKKSVGTWSKSGSKTKSEAESRLSMYSLDTLRINLHPKSSSSKDNQSSGTSKVRGGVRVRVRGADNATQNPPQQKSTRKSPRSSRRPLMRAPASTRAPRSRRSRDSTADIRTMVEAVGACASSHISRSPSPHPASARRSRNTTPRDRITVADPCLKAKDTLARRSLGASPRGKLRSISPKKLTRSPKKMPAIKTVLSSLKTIKTDQGTTVSSQMQMSPVSKIHCASKNTSPYRDTTNNTPRRADSPRHGNSPRHEKEKQRYEKENLLRHEQRNSTPRYEIGESPHVEGRDSSRPEVRDGSRQDTPRTPRSVQEIEKAEREREKNKLLTNAGGRCEVTRIVRQLCGGDAAGRGRTERVSGAKNAQLLCINGSSPRQPSTPQLLRILEETIQKKVPKTFFPRAPSTKDPDRLRLTFNIPDRTADNLFRYRTKFVQHMLTSPMYANCAVGKPWEMVGSVSEQLIDELLATCARDMQLRDVVQELYRVETK